MRAIPRIRGDRKVGTQLPLKAWARRLPIRLHFATTSEPLRIRQDEHEIGDRCSGETKPDPVVDGCGDHDGTVALMDRERADRPVEGASVRSW